MTIVTTCYKIEHATPKDDTEPPADAWTMMKTEFVTDKEAEKKVDFYRNQYPGDDWRIWHTETRMSIHRVIETARKRK